MSPGRLLDRLPLPRRSLEARLVVSFLALSFVTLGVVASVAYGSARNSLAQAIFDHLSSTSMLKAKELDRWVSDQAARLELVAAQPSVRAAADPEDLDVETLRSLAEALAFSGGDLDEVFVLSAVGGRVAASTNREREGQYHTSDLFFRAGLGLPFVQNVYPSPRTGRPTITAATPIRDAEGRASAVLAAHLDLDRIDDLVGARTAVYATTEAYLVTATHELLSASRFGHPKFLRGVHSAGIDAVIEGRNGVGLYEDYRGTPVIGAYRWLVDRELGLLVEIGQVEAFAPARRLLRKIILFGAAATLLLMVGIRIIAVRVVRPIGAVGQAARHVADGDFSTVAPVSGDDEVGELARSFNSMTDRLRGLYGDLQSQIEVSTKTLVELEQSQALLKSIVDNSTALVAVTDHCGIVRIVNAPLEQITGVDGAEAVGRPLVGLLPERLGASWQEALETIRGGAPVLERELDWIVDGVERSWLCVWFPLEDGPGRLGMGMIATELTERKRVEEERRRIEAQFRHAQKLESLGVLAGGIAHDFNNILAAILGHADLASELNREEPAEAAHHLEQVIAAARRAAELTNQMLAYAGRASFRVESLDLNKSILEISDLVTVSLPKKIALELRLAPEAIWVRGDPAQVSQVVMNLVTNAAQAIGDGSGVVSISTERSTPPDGRRARLVVRDTGCGMASETVERIFDPFFTTKEGGRGLGLAAVMGIVRGLDGTLDVESRLGVGTTFRLSFPIDGASRSAAHDEPAPTVGEPGTGTVLVVDDEDAVRQFTSKALERLGYEVIQAEDGLDALAVWQSHGSAIDAVVLDMSMPGMGGREVFEHLRRHAPGLPVLFTSGYDPSDAAGALLRETSVAFLQKPYRPGTLGQELSKLLGAVQAA